MYDVDDAKSKDDHKLSLVCWASFVKFSDKIV